MSAQKKNHDQNNRLEKILDLLQKYRSSNCEHYAGNSNAGDDIDTIIAELKTLDNELIKTGTIVREYKERMNDITNILLKYTLSDFSEKLKVNGAGDELDAIVIGLNTMAEELEWANHAQEETRKRIEATNAFLDAMLENIPNMVFVKDAEELRFVRFNKAGEELLGYSRKDLIGKNDYDFFPKEQADFFTKKDREALAKNKVTDIPEESINTSTGIRWLHTRKIPIKDNSGNTTHLLGISEDITDVRENALALKQSEENLRLMVEGARDYAIFMIDPNGIILNWNKGAEAVNGYAAHEVIGKHISIFYTDEDKESQYAATALSKAKQLGSFKDEGWRVKKDGTFFWADVTFTSLHDDLGELKGFSKISRDITDQKNAEDEIRFLNKKLEKNVKLLETANNELDAFTYSVSHDLRAPLRAIHGYTKILEEEFSGKLSEEAKHLMEGVMNNAKKMGQLIDDLLTLSRTGKKDLSKRETDLTILMNESLNELTRTVDISNTQITIDSLGLAMVDPALMKQVFINLLSNAIKYSAKKARPVIEIGSTTNGLETIIYVKDNGSGFDMQYYNKLFGVFQRLHDSFEFEGTGVGLALVKRIITRHGGKIWANAKIDEGATFYFTLNQQTIN